ncbi:MAG: DNA repair protein RadA [Ruminococcus sp.]|nr:DNA repair protein RadA [Candidatus Apopatosoma intestinale]
MKKARTVFVCKECDYQSAKWLGRCPSCGAWNTFEEETYEDTTAEPEKKTARRLFLSGQNEETEPQLLDYENLPAYLRTDTGMVEFDRVLGGGIVAGSVVLLSGEPGIGKSTLLLQICNSIAKTKKVLYVSGEESVGQISLRAKRLSVKSENLYVLTETDAGKIIKHCEKQKPDVLVIDSIQTMFHEDSTSIPGSATQIRECASIFINKAKTDGTSVLLVGHVNKEGSIAGPKVLEHMVDTVLYFEGEQRQNFRVIRAMKNRFGSTNEIGVFEMTDVGLREVENPSEALLADRPVGVSGNCAVCVIEGTRPIIAEIQALATATIFPAPRRMTAGIDYNRMALILAVLEKRLGLRFSGSDVYLNVIGGLHIDETASDLGVALALISSIRDIPIPDDVMCIGELGLSGECRAVSRLDWRVKEGARLGFRRIFVPARGAAKCQVPDGVKVIPVKSVFDILSLLAPEKK